MNLITQTYDADKWQLMPKVATDEMNAAAAYTETFAEAYTALLATAPQPPELSPWVPIDEFLKAQTYGIVWIKTKDDTRLCDYSVLNPKFIGVITGAQFSIEEIVYVMPLTRPQPPEVE